MNVRFLSPEAAVLAALVLVPLAALGVAGERGRRMREVLRLPEPAHTAWVLPALALAAIAGLLALAAAQPVLADELAHGVRRDVQAVFVLDASRSMLAASPGGPTRFQRARAAAFDLRSGLPEVPVGIASLTDRMLPHLFPTADVAAFDTVLDRAVGPDRPPPGSLWTRATSFEPLADLVTRNYFGRRVSRRVVVVFTDGESRRVSVPVLAQSLRQVEGVRLLFVRFWSRSERVRLRGTRPESYRPDPTSGPQLERLAHALGGEAVDEQHLNDARAFLREAVGHGRLAHRQTERDSLALAPYAVALCLVPLSFLLWTRNRA